MSMRTLGALLIVCAACGGEDATPEEHPDSGQAASGNGGNAASGTGAQGGAMTGGSSGGGSSGMGGTGGNMPPGGNGGSSGGGVSGGGNGGSGGTGGSGGNSGAGGGGFDPAEHCAPGEYFEEGRINADRAFGGLAIYCSGALHDDGIANGIGDNGDGWVNINSILLPEPMEVGVATAISVEIESLDGGPTGSQVEFWAATAECGSAGALEQFYAQPEDDTGIYCGSITPSAAYTYILEVNRPLPAVEGGGSTRHGFTVCTRGECPAP